MDTIREFMVSSSGLAPARRGMALGWVISVLSGVAILLGARGAAAADCPTSRDCRYDNDCARDTPATPIECCITTRWGANCEKSNTYCFCTI